MGGCYSAYACPRKLRGRLSLVLPVSGNDAGDSSAPVPRNAGGE
jgi:calcium-dependent protein kinase